MFPRCEILILAYAATFALSLPATYDQRQTGNVNYEIHLKDVQVVALVDSELLDDYSEYDYFYDYADFTVKPITKPTTSTTTIKPDEVSLETTEKIEISNTVDSQNLTIATPASQSTKENVTVEGEKIETNVDKTENADAVETTENSNNTLKSRNNDKIGSLHEDEDILTTKGIGESSTEKPEQVSRKRCRSGYFPNGKGRCRRLNQRRVSFLPLAMKLAPKWLKDITYSGKNVEK